MVLQWPDALAKETTFHGSSGPEVTMSDFMSLTDIFVSLDHPDQLSSGLKHLTILSDCVAYYLVFQIIAY